jgi:hypothetical protein
LNRSETPDAVFTFALTRSTASSVFLTLLDEAVLRGTGQFFLSRFGLACGGSRCCGRPTGPAKNLRLDPLADKIDGYLAKEIDKRSIAKLLDVSPNTLYLWLKTRRPAALE